MSKDRFEANEKGELLSSGEKTLEEQVAKFIKKKDELIIDLAVKSGATINTIEDIKSKIKIIRTEEGGEFVSVNDVKIAWCSPIHTFKTPEGTFKMIQKWRMF